MSYILDALRKADAQRERDSSRGIHAHTTPIGASRPRSGAPVWLWGGSLVAIAAVVAGAWYLLRETPAPVNVVAAPAAPVIAPPLQPPQPQPAHIAANTITPPAPAPIAPPVIVPPAVQPQPAPAAPVLTGLPPDAPHVAISGGVYSPSPAQRMLIVGGQVFNEGSEIAPGLAIEEIKPRTAVLKFRGARYTVAY